MGAPVKFTDKLKKRFLEKYREFGRLNRAAECCGVAPETVADHRKQFEWFDRAVAEAYEHYCDDLEIEARRRAIQGVEQIKTVTRDGEIITHIVYSDRLLERMLEAHIPAYRGKHQIDLTVTPGALVVPGMAVNGEVWEKVIQNGNGSKVPDR